MSRARGIGSCDEIASHLVSEGGGLISIFYHTCEFVQQEFWDGVNFKRGAIPPREEWQPPGQLAAAQTEQAFARFGQYLDHMAANPAVVFITASQLPRLLSRPAARRRRIAG